MKIKHEKNCCIFFDFRGDEEFIKIRRTPTEGVLIDVLFYENEKSLSGWERFYFKEPFKKSLFLRKFRMDEIFLNFDFRIWFLCVLRKNKNEN